MDVDAGWGCIFRYRYTGLFYFYLITSFFSTFYNGLLLSTYVISRVVSLPSMASVHGHRSVSSFLYFFSFFVLSWYHFSSTLEWDSNKHF